MKNQKPASAKAFSLNTRNTLVGLSFILPNFLGFMIFVLFPVGFSVVLSFMKWNGANAMEFIGLANFTKILSENKFQSALIRTIIFSFFTVLLTTFVALGLAVLLNKKVLGTKLFRGAIFFPYIASIVAVGVVWNSLFQKDFGPINEVLRAIFRLLGNANPALPGWTASTKWALPAVILVAIWKTMGYYMIVYLAALQNIPTELYEASVVDGANHFQFFWKITFPLLAPATFFVVLMLTINSFKMFDLIYVMTEGGPGKSTSLVVHYIYNEAFVGNRYGTASAAAMVLFVVVAIITVIQFRIEKRTAY